MTTSTRIKHDALVQLIDSDPATPQDTLARVWDAILTNLSIDERAMVQATLNKLAAIAQ